MSIGEHDALLLFRTLCKVCIVRFFLVVVSNFLIAMSLIFCAMCLQMGMKEDNDEVTTKTRILSLELLQVELGS